MKEDLTERICGLVVSESGIRRKSIRPDSRLLHDLGIFGDDARILLARFTQQFGVDLSNFQFREYFYDEPHLLNWAPTWRFLVGFRKSRKRPLTIAMLVEAATRGRWTGGDVSPAGLTGRGDM